MGKRSDYKKHDAWDLDAGCRKIIDQILGEYDE